jgi:hypothetical protein
LIVAHAPQWAWLGQSHLSLWINVGIGSSTHFITRPDELSMDDKSAVKLVTM